MKTLSDLENVIEKYQAIWLKIKAKYPKAKGQPMFGLLGEFVSIKAPLKEILTTNHHVLVDTAEKKKMLTLLKDKDASKEITNEEVFSKLKNNPLNSNCRIEIIWSEMDFDLIALLQKDELVDRELTMQRPASIRIVLGTIGKGE